MFNVDWDLVNNFTIPSHHIEYMHFALNKATGVAEVYMEFEKQVMTNTIKERLCEYGASSINLMTFQHNDGNHSAASALNRVRTVAKSEGFIEVVKGSCNPRLLTKANELMAMEKKPEDTEFDEKTQAALKMSLGEIKDAMISTKEGLSHLEEITQLKSEEINSSLVEIKKTIQDKTRDDYQITLANQAVTIDQQRQTISAQQKTIADLNESLLAYEKKNEGQRYILAKLNAERDQTAKELKEKDRIILAERQQTAKELKEKNEIIIRLTSENQLCRHHAPLRSVNGDSPVWEELRGVLEQCRELLVDFKETSNKRKRVDCESVSV